MLLFDRFKSFQCIKVHNSSILFNEIRLDSDSILFRKIDITNG